MPHVVTKALLIGGFACLASFAHAATTTQSFSFDLNAGDGPVFDSGKKVEYSEFFNGTFSLDPFDTTLGTLNAVSVTYVYQSWALVSGTFLDDGLLTSVSGDSVLTRFNTYATVGNVNYVGRLSGSDDCTRVLTPDASCTATARDSGVFELRGSFLATSTLPSFIDGTAKVSYGFSFLGYVETNADDNTVDAYRFDANALGWVDVTYHYTPAPPVEPPAVVPLPAAGWLLGTAFLGLFGSGRLRKRSA